MMETDVSRYKWGSGFGMDWVRKDETGGDITLVLPLRTGEGFVVTEAAQRNGLNMWV